VRAFPFNVQSRSVSGTFLPSPPVRPFVNLAPFCLFYTNVFLPLLPLRVSEVGGRDALSPLPPLRFKPPPPSDLTGF